MGAERPGEGESVHLALQDVLELHALILGTTADVAVDRLRDRAGLEGALARPETYARYQDADLGLQAAVLAHGIAEGQPFIDANKRTALIAMLQIAMLQIAMLTFLEINGRQVRATDPEMAEWIISFSSAATAEQVAELVRSAVLAIE